MMTTCTCEATKRDYISWALTSVYMLGAPHLAHLKMDIDRHLEDVEIETIETIRQALLTQAGVLLADLQSAETTCRYCASLDRLLQNAAPPVKSEIEIIVRLPSDTPLINWGVAMDRLTQDLGGGEWWYRMRPQQPGRYEVEVRS